METLGIVLSVGVVVVVLVVALLPQWVKQFTVCQAQGKPYAHIAYCRHLTAADVLRVFEPFAVPLGRGYELTAQRKRRQVHITCFHLESVDRLTLKDLGQQLIALLGPYTQFTSETAMFYEGRSYTTWTATLLQD
jgi:hypothetical protein